MQNLFYSFVFSLLAVAFVSCNKDELSSKRDSSADKIGCVFYLKGISDGIVTKAVGMESGEGGLEAEKAVKSLQIYVFRADSSLAASRNVMNSKSLKLDVNVGSGYSIYAVCNEENWTSSIKRISDLEEKETVLLSTDEGASSFAMQGKIEDQTISSENREFSIEVVRRAAKVVVRKITNNLPEGDIIIEGIYISNVVTNSCMFSDSLPDAPVWVNQLGVFDGLSALNWFGDKFETPVSVANGQAYETAHTFYAAANPTATDEHSIDKFSSRYTRIVIRADIGGTIYYYPISFKNEIPELTANDYIDIKNINIKHLGSDNPETPVTIGQDVIVSVEVKDWNRVEHTIEF